MMFCKNVKGCDNYTNYILNYSYHMSTFKGYKMNFVFWIIFSLVGLLAFSLLLKTNIKINKIASKKEFFPKDPQEKYFMNNIKK